jgi:hypothetical protein
MILKMGGSGWANRWGMHIRMRHAESLTNSQINEFLKAGAGIEFSGQNRKEVYMPLTSDQRSAKTLNLRRGPGRNSR